MNDKDILDIVDCIRQNNSLTNERIVDLIDKVMHDCKAKRVGQIIIDAVNGNGFEGDTYQPPKKRGRGRPKKSDNQKQMIASVKTNGRSQDF